jgi:hypothetical protein
MCANHFHVLLPHASSLALNLISCSDELVPFETPPILQPRGQLWAAVKQTV